MKKIDLATLAIISFTIALSLLPIFQPKNVWTGYGSMGSHFYKNNVYEIHYAEAGNGVGKPQIYTLSSYDRIPLVEVSDIRSELNGERIYSNLTEKIRIEDNRLIASYNNSMLTKTVEPNENGLNVYYRLEKASNLTLTFWRWYYSTVENVTVYDVSGTKLVPSNTVHYTFTYNSVNCSGEIFFNPVPDEIVVYNDGVGVNKILASFKNVENVSLTFKAIDKPENIITLASYTVYPTIAAIVSGIFFITSYFLQNFRIKYVSSGKPVAGALRPELLATLAFTVRIVLAPFFMHVWDVTTIQESLETFLSRKNVYASVAEKTMSLRQLNDVEANYEGYAYLPHAILIYLPFYLLYKIVCGNGPAILGGHNEMPLQLIEPNIYIFLLSTKLPIILADTAITYVIAKGSGKAGLVYALLPYSIAITSVWGNFDSLIGLLLLLSFLTRESHPTFSGIFYGVSLTKLFVAVTFPAYMLSLPKKRETYIKFLLGLTISQTPTILFFLQDPNSMLNVLLFHSIRSPGGVNIYNLAPKLYSYQLQSTLNKIATAALGATLLAILIKCRMGTEKIVFSLAAYMALGPVVNEQHLATLIPLLLILNYEGLVLFLSTCYLFYALLYSGPTYFMTPLAKLLDDNTIISNLNTSWTTLFNQITPQLLYTIAIVCSLTILFTIKSGLSKNPEVENIG